MLCVDIFDSFDVGLDSFHYILDRDGVGVGEERPGAIVSVGVCDELVDDIDDVIGICGGGRGRLQWVLLHLLLLLCE